MMTDFNEVDKWFKELDKDAQKYPNLVKDISIYDDMYQDNFMHYFNVGLEAAEFLFKHYAELSLEAPKKILDFPCGYGRVTRWLSSFFPQSSIYGSDLVTQGVSFCEKMFDIEKFESKKSFGSISAPGDFDIVWVGSLITHLPENKALELLDFLICQLSRGGILAISYIGEEMESKFEGSEIPYGLDESSKMKIYESYLKNGYGYGNYPNQQDYGISLISESWWRRFILPQNGLKLKLYSLAWDNHHNIALISRS